MTGFSGGCFVKGVSSQTVDHGQDALQLLDNLRSFGSRGVNALPPFGQHRLHLALSDREARSCLMLCRLNNLLPRALPRFRIEALLINP